MTYRLINKLAENERKQLTRTLATSKLPYDFTSNDYLDIAKSKPLADSMLAAVKQYGVGSTAAQTIGGYNELHAELVEKICNFTGAEDACLFSSGFMANLAAMSTLVSKLETLYLDKKCHASIIAGAKMSEADFIRYAHLDINSLAKKISGPGLIVTDSVFSMSGEIAPIEEIMQLTSENVSLMIDDAHGLGVIGKNGHGVFKAFALTSATTCTVTFGKSLGTSGAAIVGSKTIVESIRQFASPFLFTTALPPGIAAATTKAFELLENETWRHEKLQANIAYFRNLLHGSDLLFSDSKTAIQYIYLDSISKILKKCAQLASHGIAVQAIRPPTVANKDIGIRIVLSTKHEYSDLDKLFSGLINETA